ncbi:MAG TPA: hypothetical protein VMF61_03990 [Candidatus Acidoferrales bacterium]|nr:hypothetical protein [Candidatus Acidoferrales bacterium]
MGKTEPGPTIAVGPDAADTVAFDAQGRLLVVNGYARTQYPYQYENVVRYPRGSTVPSRWVQVPIPYNAFTVTPVAFDPDGDAFVAAVFAQSRRVQTEFYELPHDAATFRSTFDAVGHNEAVALVADAGANLYVLYRAQNPSPRGYAIAAYPPGASAASARTNSGLVNPVALALDQHGRLAVANGGRFSHGFITILSVPALSVKATIAGAIADPQLVAFDLRGNLYLIETRGSAALLKEFAPSYRLLRTISLRRAASALTIDPLGDVYVAEPASNSEPASSVVVYGPRGRNPIRTITAGIDRPGSLAIGPPL